MSLISIYNVRNKVLHYHGPFYDFTVCNDIVVLHDSHYHGISFVLKFKFTSTYSRSVLKCCLLGVEGQKMQAENQNKERLCRCDRCNKIFTQKEYLKLHGRTHILEENHTTTIYVTTHSVANLT